MHRAGLALLTALATALLLPAAATAATPLRQSIEVDETFLGDRLAALCGVPVEIHLEGTLTATYFYDASGTQVVREIGTAPGFKFTSPPRSSWAVPAGRSRRRAPPWRTSTIRRERASAARRSSRSRA